MHIITRPREETIRVEFNGRTYEVKMGSDGAFVPAPLGEHMWRQGLVGKGYNKDPPLRWEQHTYIGDNGKSCTCAGAPIDPYAQYVKEIPRSDIDETVHPEAVAAILGRKGKR